MRHVVSMLSRDLCKCFAHGFLFRSLFQNRLHEGSDALTAALALLNGLLGKKAACTKDIPRREGHAKVASHWDDVALEVAHHYVPPALVDGERSLAVGGCIDISSGDNPGGAVGDTEIQDLALLDQNVKSIHNLGNRSRPVPPVHVHNVDVVRL